MRNSTNIPSLKYVVYIGILGPKFGESSSEYPRVDFWQKIPKLGSTLGAVILF